MYIQRQREVYQSPACIYSSRHQKNTRTCIICCRGTAGLSLITSSVSDRLWQGLHLHFALQSSRFAKQSQYIFRQRDFRHLQWIVFLSGGSLVPSGFNPVRDMSSRFAFDFPAPRLIDGVIFFMPPFLLGQLSSTFATYLCAACFAAPGVNILRVTTLNEVPPSAPTTRTVSVACTSNANGF